MDRRRRAARTVALMSLFSMTDTREDVPVASFDGDGSDLISLIAGIEPVQDLNGYDNPWPAGGGKNRARSVRYINATSRYERVIGASYTLSAGKQYIFSFMTENTGEKVYRQTPTMLGLISASAFDFVCDGNRKSFYGTASEDVTKDDIPVILKLENDNDPVGLCYNFMIEEVGDTVTTPSEYAPYSNICPISGWTGANIHVSPTTDAADGETYSITFPSSAGTVYGGTLDVTTGKLTVDRANIASYNGETLTGRWISDRDVYSAGTTPTIGAQVVYELATPIVYDLTPTQVTTLIGTNNIWADTGDIKYIEYNI